MNKKVPKKESYRQVCLEEFPRLPFDRLKLMSKMVHFSQSQSNYIITITIPILVSLITFTSGEVTKINAMEGEDILLDFSYACNSSEITLQHSYRAPFYDSTKPESASLPENQKLIVQEESGECSIRLLFAPVLRSDAGAYFVTSYSHGRIFQDIRYWLKVDYAPGRAFCEWSEEYVDDFISVTCKARAGSVLGEIACFQNGNRVPYLTKPVEMHGTLEQTLWVRYSEPAFCCAIVMGCRVNRCYCKDIKWDPYKNATDDPCPPTTPQTRQHDSTSSQNHTLISSITVDNTTEPNSNVSSNASYLFLIIGGLVLTVIFLLIIALILSCRRHSRSRRNVQRPSEATGNVHSVVMSQDGLVVSRRRPWSVENVSEV